jgi:hypothetical protein
LLQRTEPSAACELLLVLHVLVVKHQYAETVHADMDSGGFGIRETARQVAT